MIIFAAGQKETHMVLLQIEYRTKYQTEQRSRPSGENIRDPHLGLGLGLGLPLVLTIHAAPPGTAPGRGQSHHSRSADVEKPAPQYHEAAHPATEGVPLGFLQPVMTGNLYPQEGALLATWVAHPVTEDVAFGLPRLGMAKSCLYLREEALLVL